MKAKSCTPTTARIPPIAPDGSRHGVGLPRRLARGREQVSVGLAVVEPERIVGRLAAWPASGSGRHRRCRRTAGTVGCACGCPPGVTQSAASRSGRQIISPGCPGISPTGCPASPFCRRRIWRTPGAIRASQLRHAPPWACRLRPWRCLYAVDQPRGSHGVGTGQKRRRRPRLAGSRPAAVSASTISTRAEPTTAASATSATARACSGVADAEPDRHREGRSPRAPWRRPARYRPRSRPCRRSRHSPRHSRQSRSCVGPPRPVAPRRSSGSPVG